MPYFIPRGFWVVAQPSKAVAIVRPQAGENHPGWRDALQELSGKLSEVEMRRLNYAIDG